MNALRKFGRFWYDFIVGDDWLVAAGVGVLLALTYAASQLSIPAWWSLPAGVVILLPQSLRRAVRSASKR